MSRSSAMASRSSSLWSRNSWSVIRAIGRHERSRECAELADDILAARVPENEML